MFAATDSRQGQAGVIDIAFTDRHGGVSAPPFDSLDLSVTRAESEAEVETNMTRLAHAFAVTTFATMRQVHGHNVCIVDGSSAGRPTCDALVTASPGLALCVRVADCVPVLLADATSGVIGAVHAGRRGVVEGVVTSAVESMRALGADQVEGWIGPHICGGCYEVPARMRADTASVVPTAYSCTTWGTPALDIGAAVSAQLADVDCVVHDISRCTLESTDLYSYRRDGAQSGRFAGVIVRRAPGHG